MAFAHGMEFAHAMPAASAATVVGTDDAEALVQVARECVRDARKANLLILLVENFPCPSVVLLL
jgi:hypothetical protein